MISDLEKLKEPWILFTAGCVFAVLWGLWIAGIGGALGVAAAATLFGAFIAALQKI